MRRMVKENLLKFDGTPLFPERIAYTVPYKLSDAEARLYKEVTDYVREEFNRAEALAERQARRHRRLRAHHPAAPAGLVARGDLPVAAPPPRAAGEAGCASWNCCSAAAAVAGHRRPTCPALDAEDVEDLEEAPDNEVEAAEEEILDQATAARTIAELKAEIATLERLEALALAVRRSGEDTQVARAGEPARRDLHAGSASRTASPKQPPPYGAGDDPAARCRRRARSWSSSPSTATR